MGYQDIHWEIVDYQGYLLEDVGLWFRGSKPLHLSAKEYFVCLGAAQTFGCFCEKPYPILLEKALGLQVLNLGYGGAGPYFYLKNYHLLEYINQAKFVIVQVMSGRSESNSIFDSGGLEYLTRRADGIKIGAEEAYKQLLEGYSDDNDFCPTARKFTRKVSGLFLENQSVKALVHETRNNWISSYRQLLDKIKVPKILFWFSKRRTAYKERYFSVHHLFGEFPQLVNAEMVEALKPLCDGYIECISRRGSPQKLVSRFTGKPTSINLNTDPDRQDFKQVWAYNSYYPSPEMQVDAALALKPICRKFL